MTAAPSLQAIEPNAIRLACMAEVIAACKREQRDRVRYGPPVPAKSTKPLLFSPEVGFGGVALQDFVGEGKTARSEGAPVLGRSVSGARALSCGGAAAPAVERFCNVTPPDPTVPETPPATETPSTR